MTRKRNDDTPTSTPTQQDEADIIKEIGAVPANDDSGELVADEAKVVAAGAVDAESIRENRRNQEIVDKVRSGQKGVPFNLDNVLEKYDLIIKSWPPNTLDILVKRVTGTAVQWVIQSRPRSGAELYAAILAHHGRYDEAEYDVRFIDFGGKQKRGQGRIVIPDTRDTPAPQQSSPQGQQPIMNNPSPQTPPTTDPVVMMGKMFEIFQQMQTRPASQIAPQQPVAVQPSMQPSTDPLAMMSQMFGIFQKMQQSAQPTPTAQPQPTPSTDPMAVMQESFRLFQQVQPHPSSATPVMPPPPPQGSDPSVVMAWMQQMLPIFQKMQQPQAPQVVVQPPPIPAVDPMAMMTQMFGMFQKMQQAVQPSQAPYREPGGGPPYRDPNGQYAPPRGPYTGPRPYYAGQEQRGYPPQGGGYPQQQPPQQRQKSAAEEFRDAIGIVETAVSIAERFRPQAPAAPEERDDHDDENPVRIMDVGKFKLVVDREDGSARKWETGVANMGGILQWLAEQREAVMKAAAERESRQQPRRQEPLPAGYVEVGPGYQPPPGYVAVPVDRMGGLPPPPDESEMPPPITQQEESPRPRRTWDATPVPGPGDGG